MVRSMSRKQAVMVVLAATLVGGCGFYSKRVANKAIKRVEEKSYAQAQQAEAPKYAPKTFNELARQIENAKNKVLAGQYEEAKQEAQRAEGTAQRAISEAQLTKAKVQAKYQEIRGILEQAGNFLAQAREAPSELIPETEVAAAQEEISDVQSLVQQQVAMAQQSPEDYDPIVESASAAFRAAQRAYNLTLAEQAEGVEREIAALRDEALSLEPGKYLPEEAEQIGSLWDQFDRLIRDERYEQALNVAEQLREQTTVFISAVREKRAGIELEAARSQRDKALAQGGGRFALDPMKECERALTEAENAFQAGQLDETYEAAIRSQQAAADALAELQAHAEEIVARVGREIEGAESEGAREFAPEILEDARKLHGDASLALERKAILECIEAGQQALEQAAAAISQTKKMKAQAALQRSQRSIDVAIEEGAATYAPAELKKAQDQYALAEQQFKDGAYAEVHTLAAEAESFSQHVLEVLDELAQDRLAQAESAQESAVMAQSDALAAEAMKDSRARLAESRTLLGARRYRRAIELADEAADLAKQAETTAYRLRSEQMMARAEEERAEAEKAGAPVYAGETYNTALDELHSARAKYDAGEYAISLEHATKARGLAETARRKRLDAAIASVESASEALAPQYAAETFREALSALAGAKQAMQERSYQEANQGADRAAALATQAEGATWKARAEEKAAQVTAAVQYLIENLAEQRCGQPLAECRLLLADTNRLVQTAQFREAYGRGVEAEQAAGVARACLAEQAVAAYEELSERSRELTALSMDPVGRAEAAKLYPILDQIKNALEEEQYRIVFEQTLAGMALAKQAEDTIKAHNIDLRIAGLGERLETFRSTGQSEILPSAFGALETEVQALNREQLSADYDQAVALLEDIDTRLDMFAESVDKSIDRQLLSIKQMLTEARYAGALTHVRGDYEQAVELYKRAVVLPAREDYHELAESIRAASQAASQAFSKTVVAIDEKGYKDKIRNYMLEMNSLLDRWPFAERRGTGKYTIDFLMAAKSSKDSDIYRELQRDLTDREFRERTRELYTTVQQDVPPPSLKELHQDVLTAFHTVSEAAENFYRYGLYSLYGQEERNLFLREAYAKLNELEFHMVTVQARIEGLPPPRKRPFFGMIDFRRGWDPRNYFWVRFEP